MLENEVALVTGASRGIGRAIALELAREGARVAVGARGAEGIDAVRAELAAGGPGPHLAITCGLTTDAGVDALLEGAVSALGGVDVLVNNVGGSGARTLAAGLAVFGMLDVPIIYVSVTIWRTMHPTLLVNDPGGLAPPMTQTLMVALLSFTLLFAFFLIQRVRLEQARDQVNFLREASG